MNNHACGRVINKHRVRDAYSRGAARVQQSRPKQRRHVAVAAESDEDAHRDKVKHLTKLFCKYVVRTLTCSVVSEASFQHLCRNTRALHS